MIKTAILGGSFDPVHLGHLYLLHNAVKNTDYSRFILIPAKISNFKLDAGPVSSDSDRLTMLNLALEDYAELYPQDKNKRIITSDIEIKRGGVSYTFDTVIEIKKQYSISTRLGLIMGDDHIEALAKWYRYEDLKNEVEFIICPRNKKNLDKIPHDITYRLLDVEETKEENATSIRNNIKEYGHYLSKRVFDYAVEKNLYS